MIETPLALKYAETSQGHNRLCQVTTTTTDTRNLKHERWQQQQQQQRAHGHGRAGVATSGSCGVRISIPDGRAPTSVDQLRPARRSPATVPGGVPAGVALNRVRFRAAPAAAATADGAADAGHATHGHAVWTSGGDPPHVILNNDMGPRGRPADTGRAWEQLPVVRGVPPPLRSRGFRAVIPGRADARPDRATRPVLGAFRATHSLGGGKGPQTHRGTRNPSADVAIGVRLGAGALASLPRRARRGPYHPRQVGAGAQ